jgi:putative ABC transport system permease protein
VQGVDPAAATPVLRSTADLRLPALGEVVLPQWAADAHGVRAGEALTLAAGTNSRALTAVVDGDAGGVLLYAADLRGLVPDAVPATLWLRLADGEGQRAAVDEVTQLTGAAAPGAFVTGLASERAAIDSVLDVLLLVVTGLLGVAVLIALIGVGNTLALSVVERRQENGLLRALGLTRGQLRALQAWEAVLVAGGQGEVLLDVPWLQVAAIVVAATVAGLLASVLPARRAAAPPRWPPSPPSDRALPRTCPVHGRGSVRSRGRGQPGVRARAGRRPSPRRAAPGTPGAAWRGRRPRPR